MIHEEGITPDFTTLGLDANGIYIRVLRYTPSSSNGGHTVVAVKKPEIYQGQFLSTILKVTNGAPVWTIQPAVSFDDVPTNGYAWFVAKGPPDQETTNYQGGELLYRRLHWLGTNAEWVDTNWCAVSNSVSNYRDYYDLDGTNVTTHADTGVVARASGGNIWLYEIGSRLAMTTIRNGFLWTCHTVGLNGTNGVYDSNDPLGTHVDRSAVQWFRIAIERGGAGLVLCESRRVFDSTNLTNAWWYHYPSLMVNCAGDMIAGFSGSSASNYVGAYYMWRLAGSSKHAEPRPIEVGTVGYIAGEWGDYSATTLDPTDPWSFWTVQQYATRVPPNLNG
jgi:hypothetical protein